MSGVIRSARALGWLRWRLFLNAFKGTRRRDALERVSRAGSVIVPIVLGILFVPAFLMSCAFSLAGGWAVGQRVEATPAILLAVRLALGAATGVILFIPAIRTARGPSTNLVRLALLPVPRRVLHVADTLSGITDPWIILLVPVMVLFPIGVALGGSVVSGLIGLAAGIALLVTFLALSSCVSSLLTLLYRDRRRGEIVTLVLLLTLSFAGFIPLAFNRYIQGVETRYKSRQQEAASRAASQGASGAEGPRADAGGATGGSGAEQDPDGASVTGEDGADRAEGGAPATGAGAARPRPEDEVRLPAAVSILPSELYARALVEPLRGRTGIGLLALLGVGALGSAFYGVSWRVYRRLLDSPENISPRRGARAEPRVWRLPGLGPAASAIALAQVRLVLRTVHGKMAVYFTPVSILAAGFLISSMGRREVDLFGDGTSPMGPLMAYGGVTFALLAPQRFLLNLFATDGAGLTLALLSPVSDRELVVGKSAGMAFLSAIPMTVITGIVAVFAPPAPLALWCAVLVAAVSSYIVLAPGSALISAVFPKATDMNRLSGASNPNGIATLLGLLLTVLSCSPPALVALMVYFATGSGLVVLLSVLGWGIVAAGISFLMTHAAALVVGARRENLALVAQGR